MRTWNIIKRNWPDMKLRHKVAVSWFKTKRN